MSALVARRALGMAAAAKAKRPKYVDRSPVDLGLDRVLFDRLVRFGVPFHAVDAGKQDESPKPRSAGRRLARGQTLFLIQPHEYMPRLRRFLYRFGYESGFAGMLLRSFAFRVDKPGSAAMAEHDDGASHLLWYQVEGERHAAFGEPDMTSFPPQKADGRRKARFEGALPRGSLLYLPPFTSHRVGCRSPSLAISAYWEKEDAFVAAEDWLAFLQESHPEWKDLPLARLWEKSEKEWNGTDGAVFRALRRTRDDGLDAPPEMDVDLENPEQVFSAYRALEVVEDAKHSTVAAGGTAILGFPAGAFAVLKRFERYGVATRTELASTASLKPKQLTLLLEVLIGEEIIFSGKLPAAGEFYADELSGSDYTAA